MFLRERRPTLVDIYGFQHDNNGAHTWTGDPLIITRYRCRVTSKKKKGIFGCFRVFTIKEQVDLLGNGSYLIPGVASAALIRRVMSQAWTCIKSIFHFNSQNAFHSIELYLGQPLNDVHNQRPSVFVLGRWGDMETCSAKSSPLINKV